MSEPAERFVWIVFDPVFGYNIGYVAYSSQEAAEEAARRTRRVSSSAPKACQFRIVDTADEGERAEAAERRARGLPR